MNDQIPHLRGRRLVEPRHPIGLARPPQWVTDPRRRCSPQHPDAHQWTSDEKSDLTLAARKCQEHCPFLAECLARAVGRGEQHFVWGGVIFSKAKHRAAAAAEVGPATTIAGPAPAKSTRAQAKARLDAGVREHWDAEQPDSVIALKLGVALGTVVNVRKRLRLPALYGPNGRRVRQAVSA